MATKNNPGNWDCYANAAPDEPMFVLLGRDRHAAALVALWASLRAQEGEDAAKVIEAQECAKAMFNYAIGRCGKTPITNGDLLRKMIEPYAKLMDTMQSLSVPRIG